MTEIMKFAMTKASFEKADVIKLIESLPGYMQEDAFLIAIGTYKIPECAKIGNKGIKDDTVYIVNNFNPFSGVRIVNIEDEEVILDIPTSIWKTYNNDYNKCIKEQQEDYVRKQQELQKEYQQKIKQK